jgi:hypothetical protein
LLIAYCVREYNPPPFIVDAHKKALDSLENNQYGPTSVSVLGLSCDARGRG